MDSKSLLGDGMYFFSGGKFGWSFWWSFWDIVGHRGIGTKFSWVGIGGGYGGFDHGRR